MNCRRVQKLMPLHVEGDLPATTAQQIVSHLEWCGRCNWLADEYNENQRWLHAAQPPEFDEAMLDHLKQGVLKRVGEVAARPSVFASLAEQFNRRQILALSATLLILLGVVVFYFYQARAKVNREVISQVDPSTQAKPVTVDRATMPHKRVAQGANSSGEPRRVRRSARLRHRHSVIAKQRSERETVYRTGSERGTAGREQQDVLSEAVGRSRDMLRIEIQTGDPSIRIIWFAPRDTDLHQSKPATD